MAIYLVRHMQSAGNARLLFQGRQDFPLTDLGEQQARQLGGWLRGLALDWQALIASPLQRARHTAELLGAALALPAPELEPRLVEFSGGALEGLTGDEIDARWPDYALRPLEARGDFARFGGESYEQMQVRLGEFVAGIHGRFTQHDNVLIVTHGGTLYQLLKLWCGWPVPRHFFNHIGNGCCFKLELREVSGHQAAEMHWMLPLEVTGASVNGRNAEMESKVQTG